MEKLIRCTGDVAIPEPITSKVFGKIPGIPATKGKLSGMLLEERRKDKEKEA